jgi:hypothetical protein
MAAMKKIIYVAIVVIVEVFFAVTVFLTITGAVIRFFGLK